jgi:septum formation protein
MSLILASSSPIRRELLANAGVEVRVVAPACDEDFIKERHSGDGATLARRLAEMKAQSVAVAADDWVIGSDSTVTLDRVRYSKPRDRDEAARHLAAFSGRTLELASAAALVRGGKVDWSVADVAHLHVRPLSKAFMDDYLGAEWPVVAYCVGVFRLEGRGVTLFDRVEGSHFTILGLPLLPLLSALRQRDVMAS